MAPAQITASTTGVLAIRRRILRTTASKSNAFISAKSKEHMSEVYLGYVGRIVKIASELFDQKIEVVVSDPPYIIHFEIKAVPIQRDKYQPKLVEVSLRPEANFLFIDDFRLEYEDDTAKAESEVTAYLKALFDGRVKVKGLRFINEHLDIDEGSGE
jgi:hypothetical protein